MSLFLPITKVDVAQRLVYGTISEEVPDKMGEILDYESARPAFEEWSRQFREASGGKSLGNVRAMHGAIAAGKLTDIQFDDVNKRIDGVAKIVDEEEWRKVQEGVYTGFSIGGGYARRWQDKDNPELMRYTPVLAEVSLVDNPAVPTATFQLVRMDGSITVKKFTANEDKNEPDDSSAAEQLRHGLVWLANHAKAIGAKGLLKHIRVLQAYIEEIDEKDDMQEEPANKLLSQEIDALQKRITELESQPLPAKGILRVVHKNDMRAESDSPHSTLTPVERAKELMKIALANPIYL